MQSARRAGRPQRPVAPGAGPGQELALALRKLREDSGNPPYRVMAERAHYSASTLARAASGTALPNRDLVLAYVRACGGDQAEWDERWGAAAQAEHNGNPDHADRQDSAAARTDHDGEPQHARRRGPQAREPRVARLRRRPRRITAAVGSLLAVAGIVTAVSLSGAGQHHQAAQAAGKIAYRDGDDPAVTGCDQDVQTLEEVPVYLVSGQRFGALLLRHSPSCAMSWGAVWGPDPHLYRVYITADRPADGAQAPSSWALNTPPGSYGNMLSTSRSCVQIEAYVRTSQGPGPVARTDCLR